MHGNASHQWTVDADIGLGFFHTGVEIAGDEFSFASGAGVFSSTPRDAPGAFNEIGLGSRTSD
jgi:hypothetical protein